MPASLEQRLSVFETALKSIAANTCCEPCREAANVAAAAIAQAYRDAGSLPDDVRRRTTASGYPHRERTAMRRKLTRGKARPIQK